MKTILYWFSGTGNSLWIARTLADRLGDTELRPVTASGPTPPDGTERIGIVYPVYAFSPPSAVLDWIDRFAFPEGARVFVVTNCASQAGAAVSLAERHLKKRGVELDAGYIVKMPPNYPPFGGPGKPETVRKRLASAPERIGKIVGNLDSDARRIERGNVLLRGIGRVIGLIGLRHFRTADRQFRVTDACTRCGRCVAVCPVENIRLDESGPAWLHHCEQCFACYHHCPEQAILFESVDPQQPRYRHPDIDPADLCVRTQNAPDGSDPAGASESC